MKKQRVLFDSGNELAAYAAKQINYHVMGYYPITPSTQIAEFLDQMKADGEHDISLIAAEGEHSAAGICYGASTGGGRVFNATSANGLLYALEELPVQSGTRFPMVMNVACRTVSGPLSIKGDHSDIMYTLNTGWVILFANSPQAVYDFNICALKLAERVKLPVIVAFDGFFTSHQKRRCEVFEEDSDVQAFVGKYDAPYSALDLAHPVSIGSYMNEPDIINNKFQLHLAMEQAREAIPEIFAEYEKLSGRAYCRTESYLADDAEVLLFLLGSSYHTAKVAADRFRAQGKKVGVFTTNVLRPFPGGELAAICKNAKTVLVGDRQDSYGAEGGNMSLEIRAALQRAGVSARVLSRVYGLGGLDFYVEDAERMIESCYDAKAPAFDYLGSYPGEQVDNQQYFAPITEEAASPGLTTCVFEDGKAVVRGGRVNETTAMPKRLAPGHGACPGCGIPVNVNLLLRGIEGNVVLLFQTGCGMVVTTAYPKTSFRVPYVHNLFQNGAATLAGLVEMCRQRQKRGELPEGEITFVMVSGDGGMDIGMGSAIGTALRNNHLILFEYDNGGYMNTGYQLSYSTPMGAKSSTSHVGPNQYGKNFFHKDTPMIMAATNIPYVATVAECNPADFLKKAAKAKAYAAEHGMAYLKALSACPLNWGDKPNTERRVIQAGVDCCYFPLYEIERGITKITYDPEAAGKKLPAADWLGMMGRTKHLMNERYADVVQAIQNEIDHRWLRLKARNDCELL
ncbi:MULTISPECIES: thiamine pyrophosphate-dependent enzyme [Anaerotruncus]|uniref:Pyruvate synthase n=2 Tax=Anaerotruncus TaxID=244127 RepID=A0A498CR75_9FIRM|nr:MULTISPECIES: thiamine pyrophosphate-dependent enzyme [Anaerotruncus]MBC3937555.1 pyruvate synthase [Anaerotruncus massiliensis (ex Togo et al. 2019)]MCQ4894406.1 thiamine pyrophosphate-dependent enzyme [Anaerotruncus sp. DFI.9.16]RLL14666.1 pyruvate synthase [Anaerotruncus massiliensis (ex Liu et al. 2021)]